MKKIIQFLAFFILITSSLPGMAQQKWNAAGVWTGNLFNDTTKKFIPFEIAISYQNGKYSGYTYTVFVIDGAENIGVKSVTIKEKSGSFVIRDKKLIDDNYKAEADKGVYTTLELSFTENDSVDILSGHWNTNRTKEFYPVGGSVMVTKRKNIFATRIIPKLQNLGLLDQLSFYDYQRKQDREAVAINNSDRKKSEEDDSMMTIVEQPVVITIPKKKSPEITLPASGKMDKLLDSLQKKDSPTVAVKTSNLKNTNPVSASGNLNEKKVENPISTDKETIKRNAGDGKQIVSVLSPEKATTEKSKNGVEEIKNISPKPGDKNAIAQASTESRQIATQNRNNKKAVEDLKADQSRKETNQKSEGVLSEKKNSIAADRASQTEIQKAAVKTETPVQKVTMPASANQSPQILVSSETKAIENKIVDTVKNEIVLNANASNQTEIQKTISKPVTPVLPKIDVSKRKIETIRTVPVAGDSLVLSLYDNGIIDGDTVSVLLNGNVILSKIGLLATAYNKTIHLTPDMGDSIKIILYAENLGSIPPNTGLLIVRNAGQDYEIRFSGDLQKNSAIILLRKKEE